MPVQRTSALLLLAVVFLMHGAPSMATDPVADGGAPLAASRAATGGKPSDVASEEASTPPCGATIAA